jgi:hypothetical protein
MVAGHGADNLTHMQAHDFEAYQDLLRSEPGAAGVGTGAGAEARYEAVSKFLADTEEYIHKLAGKVCAPQAPCRSHLQH